jgi:hypothetical protein
LEASADEEHAESVVAVVAEPACDTALEFDESVDGFSAAVASTASVEVAQEGFTPLA